MRGEERDQRVEQVRPFVWPVCVGDRRDDLCLITSRALAGRRKDEQVAHTLRERILFCGSDSVWKMI